MILRARHLRHFKVENSSFSMNWLKLKYVRGGTVFYNFVYFVFSFFNSYQFVKNNERSPTSRCAKDEINVPIALSAVPASSCLYSSLSEMGCLRFFAGIPGHSQDLSESVENILGAYVCCCFFV